jgi:hypothetical protein
VHVSKDALSGSYMSGREQAAAWKTHGQLNTNKQVGALGGGARQLLCAPAYMSAFALSDRPLLVSRMGLAAHQQAVGPRWGRGGGAHGGKQTAVSTCLAFALSGRYRSECCKKQAAGWQAHGQLNTNKQVGTKGHDSVECVCCCACRGGASLLPVLLEWCCSHKQAGRAQGAQADCCLLQVHCLADKGQFEDESLSSAEHMLSSVCRNCSVSCCAALCCNRQHIQALAHLGVRLVITLTEESPLPPDWLAAAAAAPAAAAATPNSSSSSSRPAKGAVGRPKASAAAAGAAKAGAAAAGAAAVGGSISNAFVAVPNYEPPTVEQMDYMAGGSTITTHHTLH